jgi:hypothetical protein
MPPRTSNENPFNGRHMPFASPTAAWQARPHLRRPEPGSDPACARFDRDRPCRSHVRMRPCPNQSTLISFRGGYRNALPGDEYQSIARTTDYEWVSWFVCGAVADSVDCCLGLCAQAAENIEKQVRALRAHPTPLPVRECARYNLRRSAHEAVKPWRSPSTLVARVLYERFFCVCLSRSCWCSRKIGSSAGTSLRRQGSRRRPRCSN